MNSIFIILVVSVALSYGWGMRGSLMGGLRGAVLPGALLGMFLALFSGNEMIARNFYIFAAVGGSAMAFGGSETYGETLGFIIHHNGKEYNPKKGYIAVFLKGSLWHGISGALLGITFSSVSGKYYNGYDIILVLALIPLVSVIGERIFNNPFNPKKNIFPRFYFSLERQEEWGGNVLVNLMLLIFTFIRKDWYAFFFCIVGLIGGGLGFSLGMAIYDYIITEKKNGKKIAGKYNKNLDGWKAMEFSFGAIAGLFFTVYFLLTKDTMLAERLADVKDGMPIITSPVTPYATVLSYISLALVPLIRILTLFEDKIGEHLTDLLERPVLYVFPMILAVSGCELSAKLNAFALVVFFAFEKVVFERNRKAKLQNKIILGIILGACTVASVLMCIFTDIPFIYYIFMYTVFYIIADNIPAKKPKDSRISVMAYFILQTVFLITVSYIIA